MSRIRSFRPIITPQCRILVLGTVPGKESFQKGEYYADRRNQFWQLVYRFFNTQLEPSYEKRTAFLLDKGIALWDVIGECDRNGSSDSTLRNITANDFDDLFKEHGNQWYVCFNGSKAAVLYDKYVGRDMQNRYVLLPSTSKANSMSFDLKAELWGTVLEHLLFERYMFR